MVAASLVNGHSMSAGSKEAALPASDSNSRKRRADAPPEPVPRSQQRRGDDPPLPPPGRLAKQAASAVAIQPPTKLRSSAPPASIPKTRGNGVNAASIPTVLHGDKSATGSQPSGKRSHPKAVDRSKESRRSKVQAPAQQQRKVLQQPRGPDCAPQARPRMHTDAGVTVCEASAAKAADSKATAVQQKAPRVTATAVANVTAIKLAVAVQNAEVAVKRRPDALPRSPNLPASTDRVGSEQQPPFVVAASPEAASNHQPGRMTRNPVTVSRGSKGPAASNAPSDAQPKILRKAHPQVSSNHKSLGLAKGGVELHSKPPQHAPKPVQHAGFQPTGAQQEGTQQRSAEQSDIQPGDAQATMAGLLKVEEANKQPVKSPPPVKLPSSAEAQPASSPHHVAVDVPALQSEAPHTVGSRTGKSIDAVQPPAEKRSAEQLATAGSGSTPALARMCYLPAGASVPRCLGAQLFP